MRIVYGKRPRGRKIYVSRLSLGRAGCPLRVMVNEGELIERLAGMGFDIVTPEDLSVRDQIATFASASLVVGRRVPTCTTPCFVIPAPK